MPLSWKGLLKFWGRLPIKLTHWHKSPVRWEQNAPVPHVNCWETLADPNLFLHLSPTWTSLHIKLGISPRLTPAAVISLADERRNTNVPPCLQQFPQNYKNSWTGSPSSRAGHEHASASIKWCINTPMTRNKRLQFRTVLYGVAAHTTQRSLLLQKIQKVTSLSQKVLYQVHLKLFVMHNMMFFVS